MTQEYNQILKDLSNKQYKPIYFLFGDESFYIDNVVDFIEKNALAEHEKAFNQQIIYGKDVSTAQIKDIASRLPMAATHQVIIVKEAQQLKSFEELENYFNHPVPSTILVLAYKHSSPDKRKKIFKNLINQKESVALESKAIRDYEVVGWISSYAKEKGLKINPKGIEILAEFLGTDISKIVNELDKLLLVKGNDKNITEEDIEKNIGASKDYNIFEFTDALGHKNYEKTYKILHYFEQNPKSLVLQMALGTINGFYQKIYLTKFSGSLDDKSFGSLLKLHPFIAKEYKRYANKYSIQQLENIFKLIGEYDLKSKGLGNKSATHSELLTELTYKIYAV